MYEILIVDDHTHLVDSLANALPWEDMGISAVHKAYSGEEALELLQYHGIDLIVTDIQMTGISGLELVSVVKEKWAKIKSVILTGHDEFHYAQEAIRQGICNYLLKPVSNEELESTLRALIGELQREGDLLVNQQKLAYLFRESLPKLRESLLQELLAGKMPPMSRLRGKLKLYELPFDESNPFIMLFMRIEEDFAGTDLYSVSLLEYALTNIADEIFSPRYEIWHCTDDYDYVVFLVRPKQPSESSEKEGMEEAERLARLVQHQIKRFLKIKVSLVMSNWSSFPHEVPAVYHHSLSLFTDYIGFQTESFFHDRQERSVEEIRPLSELYASPTFMQLLEVEQWDDAEAKMRRVFEELERRENKTREFVFEAYITIMQAFSYYVHKKGKRFYDIYGREAEKMLKLDAGWSIEPLREWSVQTLQQLKTYSGSLSNRFRNELINRVVRFVNDQVKDVTLQSAADHVHLHPVYVSNLFKLETGDNFSNYVLRVRMDLALQLLKQRDVKINWIAQEVGYQKPQYFIKLFKTHYGMTPQEYKNSLQ
ncbi:response regulator transcription factor [Paenibacillus sacheonensis]|uniref:Response regulator n=1 Tax=Paenibacillus sacheonensis TaxID=742054 RepID=A0A7X5C0V0_9BACL|nr:response regulator [Paenibacillus sacheonensis]MBM7567755.1 two-component system response regulator YesN [Paenibacillus sacheonensis]NBC71971.1 response regulator [Paenibacillus sacheonensis]